MTKLDQFYTKPGVAKKCWQTLKDLLPHLFSKEDQSLIDYIEPSAGCCDFFDLLPKDRRVGIDIDPKAERNLIKADFLTYQDPSIYREKTVVVGNPPFGHKSSLAIEFFNQAATLADTIAFIVPVQWRKYSVHKQLTLDFDLISQTELPPSSFYILPSQSSLKQLALYSGKLTAGLVKDYLVNTEFQVWTRLKHNLVNKRLLSSPPIHHVDFDMWQYNATKQAESVFENLFDFAVLRQGYGDFNQKIVDKRDCSLKKQWILFKAKSSKALQILNKIDFVKLSQNNTVVPGFGKADVILEYERIANNDK